MALAKGTPWWTTLPPLAAAVSLVALPVTPLAWAPLVGFVILTVLFLNFFRDPHREVGDGVVSGADGRVTEVSDVEGRLRIVVFMSPLNVHVNRAPVTGTLKRLEHVPGAYLPAFRKESERNERMVWDIASDHGDVRMVQIAGTVARRIVPYVDAGAEVERGERVGLIRFGSRVDVYVSPEHVPTVGVGERVRAGQTIARRREASP